MAINKIQVKRKIISLSIIGLAFVLYSISHQEAVWLMVFVSGTCILLDLLYHKIDNTNTLLRLYFNLYPKKEHEYTNVLSDASIFFLSTLIMVLIFTKEIIIFSLVIFTVVDITSHIFGIAFHRGELFWNQEKTWGGVIPSFFFALFAGYFMVKLIPNIELTSLQIISVSVLISILGTANKLDNITMPWGTAIFLGLFG